MSTQIKAGQAYYYNFIISSLDLVETVQVASQFHGHFGYKLDIFLSQVHVLHSAVNRQSIAAANLMQVPYHAQQSNSATEVIPGKIVLGKHQNAVDKISQVVEELRVVLHDKVCPVESTVLCLWSYVQEVEAIDIGSNLGVLGIIPKHTNSSTLGEFPILIVQVLCMHTCKYRW